MADAYRKVGRGGAGNFYSQKDIEEATAPQQQQQPSDDLEAQKQKPAAAPFEEELPTDPANEAPLPAPSMVPTTDNHSSSADTATPVYVRSGRGGAGNFVDPETASSTIRSQAQARPATVHTTGNQTLAGSAGGGGGGGMRLSGRGGAGNYSQSAAEEQRKTVVNEEQERKRREALDKHIFDDVRAGLQEPGRAHTRVHPHGRGRGATGLEES